MSLFKHFIATKLAKGLVSEDQSLIAATSQNSASSHFSLLKNIHGSQLTTADVTNHLKAVDDTDDSVDTVAFGLETTDGEIVKVYVNAEEAEAFEQKMSQMLGRIDDIEQAIEELSDDFDIVSVIRPGQEDAQEINSMSDEQPEVEVGIENRLDEPLTDDDIVQDLDDEDLVQDETEKEKSKKEKSKDDSDKEDSDAEVDSSEEKDQDAEEPTEGEEDLDVEDDSEDQTKDSEADDTDETEDTEEDNSEEKDPSEDDSQTDDTTDSEEKDPSEDEDQTEDDKSKDKKKTKKKSTKEVDDMKQESLLQSIAPLLNEDKQKSHEVKPKKPESHEDIDDQADDNIFHLTLTKDEEELSKIFTTPAQRLIFRVILLLGVNSDQISIRKFKVRKCVKDVATEVQNHPQLKNILNKLGSELASKKSQIYKLSEEKEEDKVAGTIKDQLSTEISKKIYDLILALGVPEFLLTYKKTDFRNRIKNLAKLAVKHPRIKTYIYMLSDLLKAERKGSLKEEYENSRSEMFKTLSLLEQFSKTDSYADLGTFSVVSMGEVGGTTLKVKDFSLEFSEADFEKLVTLLSKGKSGTVKSENKGKIYFTTLASGNEYVIKYIKPSANEKYPFGVLLSAKSIKKILA